MAEAITVSKLNTYIKQIFDAEELLHNIPVIGEVFGVSISRNVIYFSLKDENATLPCVCFYPSFAEFIKEGVKIIAVGSPNFYVKGGKLNFNVTRVETVGQGKLYEEFIKLKERLQSEGLFDATHKKPIPKDIKRIGVITSKEGAVIQDIKNVAWRRNPNIDIVLFNTKVQGNFAENEIANAINLLGTYNKVDVIVVARGGGSMEDLSPYNTEIVARATYNCPKPIVSAVGHETDFTIIDFVSDLRAPTPSAAAELLTYNLMTRKDDLTDQINRFISSANKMIYDKRTQINNSQLFLQKTIDKLVVQEKGNLLSTKQRLTNHFQQLLNQKYYDLGLNENTLLKINPISILDKGYAKIEQNNKPIDSKQALCCNESFNIIFKDGTVTAKIEGE